MKQGQDERRQAEDRKYTARRLERSNKQVWRQLSSKDRKAVIDLFYRATDIESSGLSNILEINRNLRVNVGSLALGATLGIFGGFAADAIRRHLPQSGFVDAFFIIVFIGVIWQTFRLMSEVGAEHLGDHRVLEHLVRMAKGSKPRLRKRKAGKGA